MRAAFRPGALISFVVWISVLPAAHAANFRVPPGTSQSLASVADNDVVRMTFSLGRSYCCEIWARDISTSDFTSVNDNAGMPLPSAVSRGRASPEIANGTGTNKVDSRKCFTGELIPGGVTNQIAALPIDMTPSPVANVIARCYETTLVGGFNTSVTDFNFLEITNTLAANADDDGVVEGRIIARNAINDTEVLNTTFTVNPGDRVDVNLHDSAGAGAFGPIILTHNGPLGAVQATVSQYRIVTTAPLAFEPAAQSVLRPAGAQ